MTATIRNRYRVVDCIGKGGGGSVYAVEDLRSIVGGNSRIVLKAHFADDPDGALLALLKAEFRLLAALDHPRLAQVFDFGTLPAGNDLEGSDGRAGFFFTREYIGGVDLGAYCKGRSMAEICGIVAQTCELLDVLHRTGMLHGDFKPDNVIVDHRGAAHLIDFGLVRVEGEEAIPSGTAHYIAPETLRGDTVDRRADLYALGITLYSLVCGKLPFDPSAISEVLSWHLYGDPLRLAEYDAKIPTALDEVVRRLTERDPVKRYPSAAEVGLILRRVASNLQKESVPAPPAVFVIPTVADNLAGPLGELEEYVKAIQEKTPVATLVEVIGEAGAGKTRLLRELSWRAQLDGVEVLNLRCIVNDPRPMGIFSDFLDQLAAFSGLKNPLAEFSGDDDLSPYTLYQCIADYLADIACRRPLALLLDEAEDADSDIREALRYVAHTLESKTPLLIVVAHRGEDALSAELGSPPFIRLPPMDQREVEDLLHRLSGREQPHIAAEILSQTGGNRAHTRLVLERLWQAGWPPTMSAQFLQAPESIHDAYREQWRQFNEKERRLLAAVAVYGRRCDKDILVRLSELTSVDAIIEALVQGHWLAEVVGEVSFRHGALRSLVYRWTPADKRQSLHALAAEQKGGTDAERLRHLLLAKNDAKAELLLLPTLQALRRRAAHRVAVEILDLALPLYAAKPSLHQSLQLQLGQLLAMAGKNDRAEIQLRGALESAVIGERSAAAVALAGVLRATGRASDALAVLVDISETPGLDDPLRAQLLSAKADTLTALDEYGQVLETVDNALLNCPGMNHGLRALLLARKARVLAYRKVFDEAEQTYVEALAHSKTAGDLSLESEILTGWAVAASLRADYSRAKDCYEKALASASKAGNIARVAETTLNQATFYLQRGAYGPCLRRLPASRRLFEAMGADYTAACGRCNEGFLYLRVGLFEQGRQTLQQALQQMTRLGRRSGEALATLLLAWVDVKQGRLSEGRQRVANAVQLYLELGLSRDAADALLDLAELELDEGDIVRFNDALQQASANFDLRETPDLHARKVFLEARLAAADGDDAQRKAHLQAVDEALKIADKLDSLELQWTGHGVAMALAEASGRPTDARQHASKAYIVLDEMADGLPAEAANAFWAEPMRRDVRERALLEKRTAAVSNEKVSQSFVSQRSFAETLAPMDITIERLYRLLEIYRRINSERDPDRLLGLVMDTAVELTGAERGFLLLGESASQLRVEVARNLDPAGESAAYSRSIAERVFLTGAPVITVSAHSDPRFSDYPSVHQMQLESVLCIPVHSQGRVCGVLYMESRFQSGRFSPEDQRLLMAFGDQVAISLTNARLLADNIRKASELQRANEQIEALAEERKQHLQERTAQLAEAQRDLVETRRQLESLPGRFGLVGRSRRMGEIYALIERIAAADIPVLIEGESGTGKEMVARAIHNDGPRKKKRLVSVNCAAIPENLLESELFGHVRGAFTGADRERKGLFSAADGGTLFLDEIGDMPMRMQVDMLRALQEKVIRPVGSEKDIHVDVRIVAASNKPLPALVEQGLFREDLFYRLHVVKLDIPPLRDRLDDIPLLVDHFLENISRQVPGEKKGITKRALKALMAYSWPGNVRQLEHALMNAAVLADGIALDVDDFTLDAPVVRASHSAESGDSPRSIETGTGDEGEKEQIVAALKANGWNKSQAAASLGIPRRTFYRRLKAYAIG